MPFLQRLFPIDLLILSTAFLVLCVVLTPVDGDGYMARDEIPAACAVACGLIFAFLAARRLQGWRRVCAYLLLLLQGLLYVSALWHLRVDFAYEQYMGWLL